NRTHVLFFRIMRPDYREEPCRSALNRVKGMSFKWSLNPYTGCVHRCTFCYVRAFELRADPPFDDRYGRSIRVKTNVADGLRAEPGTAPPRPRLTMIRRLSDAGIRIGIGMAPILPGLSDRPEQLADVVRAARDAGAHFVWTNLLYLRPGTREHFLNNLARD